MERALQKIFLALTLGSIRASEREIGYRLTFEHVPAGYVQGFVAWPMTRIWRKFGLDVKAGLNYWTIGKSLNGTSTRFVRESPEYQSWLGGYIVKRSSQKPWTFQDHFTLAVADQNSWLRHHGDPRPFTEPDDAEPVFVENITSNGHEGKLYEFGCTTHSDIGSGNAGLRFLIEWIGIAALFNNSNTALRLKSSELKPRVSGSYEPLQLRGYIAVFELPGNVSVVLYANGTLAPSTGDTFTALKGELRRAIASCQIVPVP